MTTFTNYDDGGTLIAASSGGNAAGAPAQTVLTGVFDASKRNMVAADVVEVVNIPAGTLVSRVFLEVITVEAAKTVNVGDGADPNGYVAAASTATAATLLGDGALVTAAGKLYTAADTIDIEAPAGVAFTVLKVRIIVECTRVG